MPTTATVATTHSSDDDIGTCEQCGRDMARCAYCGEWRDLHPAPGTPDDDVCREAMAGDARWYACETRYVVTHAWSWWEPEEGEDICERCPGWEDDV